MGSIGKLLSKIWKVLRKVLAVVLIVLAVWFSFGGALVLFGATLTGGWAALAALGLALLVDAETVTEVATNLGSAVGTVVGGAVGAVVSSSGLGTFAMLALGGFLLWQVMKDKDDDAQSLPDSSRDVVDGNGRWTYGS